MAIAAALAIPGLPGPVRVAEAQSLAPAGMTLPSEPVATPEPAAAPDAVLGAGGRAAAPIQAPAPDKPCGPDRPFIGKTTFTRVLGRPGQACEIFTPRINTEGRPYRVDITEQPTNGRVEVVTRQTRTYGAAFVIRYIPKGTGQTVDRFTYTKCLAEDRSGRSCNVHHFAVELSDAAGRERNFVCRNAQAVLLDFVGDKDIVLSGPPGSPCLLYVAPGRAFSFRTVVKPTQGSVRYDRARFFEYIPLDLGVAGDRFDIDLCAEPEMKTCSHLHLRVEYH